MRIAFLFDIHANLPALNAVLAEVQRAAPDAILHGGDLIGWGPQPNEVVSLIAERGIEGVVGNHELLCLGAFTEEHPLRNESTAWTAETLSRKSRNFVAALRPQVAAEKFLLSHANPAAWREPPDAGCFPYLESTDDLLEDAGELRNAPGGVIVTGHVHVPTVYAAHFSGAAIEMRQMAREDAYLEVSLGAGEWLFVVVGAIGKPRDGVPAANYALLDTEAGTITLRRVSYDVQSVCEMIRRADGLPEVLADQLAEGV
jgi:diadenosine tetraphosphatase ApaH/serine/threonine PP2A family protein phosphatase